MASKEYYDIAYGLRDLAKELNRSDVIDTIDSEIKKMKFDELGKNINYSYISKPSKNKEENKDKYKPLKKKTILVTEKLEDDNYVNNNDYNDDWTIDDEDDIENYEEDGFNNGLSFNDFLNEAEIILVDNAFEFDINEWEKENQEEINEELSEDINNVKNITTPQFIKYQLTPDKVKEIVNKIINSEFNIINYWKTNQFKKKNNLTDDDLKDILKTLNEQDYKTNSISTDNSKNEAIIFIKQTNIKNLNNIKVYIKLDYDSIENSPVIVLSFHSKKQKSQLTSSYNNVKRVNDNGYSNSELLEDLYDDDWTMEDEDDIENYEEDNPITPEQEAFANEIRDFLQSLIDKEEQEDEGLEEQFTSQNSLIKHFKKHCLANVPGRVSTKNNIYYDFNTIKRYSKYEQKLYDIFKQGVSNTKNQYDFIDDIFNIDDVNKKFIQLFKGNFTLFISGIFGLRNSRGIVNLGIHSFSSDVTTNYRGGNTLDICILTSSPKTITLYPVDASTLKKELLRIFKNFSTLSFTPSKDATKLLDSLNYSKTKYLTEGVSDDDKYLSMDYDKAMDSNWEHYIFSVETKDGSLHDERGRYSDDNSFNNAVNEIKRRYGNNLYSINALHDKGILKYYTDLYNRYLKHKKEEAQSENKQNIQNNSNNQQSLKNNNNSTNSNTSQNSNSTQNNQQQQNNFQQTAKRKTNPIYRQRTKNNSKIVQAFKSNGLPTDKLTQQVVDKNGRKYTRATSTLKKLRKDLFGENLKEDVEQDKPDYLDKLDLKSNGIYSLNTGWVKHPVQQDIPDIDMEEFEKEFKVWEDRYFDLLDKIEDDSKENLTEI